MRAIGTAACAVAHQLALEILHVTVLIVYTDLADSPITPAEEFALHIVGPLVAYARLHITSALGVRTKDVALLVGLTTGSVTFVRCIKMLSVNLHRPLFDENWAISAHRM